LHSEKYNQGKVIKECKRGKISSQHLLYMHYYSYAMSICLRYTKTRETAEEILNDSFFKVFTHIKKYNANYPFKSWLRKIIINTAIDYYRKQLRQTEYKDINMEKVIQCQNKALDNLETEDILNLLRNLSHTHRIVFNLYEMEGYHHQEIAKVLGITEGTSRSYLKRAKEQLRTLYNKYFT
jgi:RNA polymerase sigma factor (sigma-70 family)